MATRSSFVAAAAGLTPIAASSAGALASLAFFRPWVEFIVGPEGVSATMNGGTLARQYSSSIPWVYVTPGSLVIIIVIAAVVLVKQGRLVQISSGLAMCLFSAPSITWPIVCLARFIRAVSHLNSAGLAGNVALGGWWWLYFISLLVILVSGIINLAAAFQARDPSPPSA